MSQAKKDWNKKYITRINDVVIYGNEPCPCGCGQKAKNHLLKNIKRPLTELAKKEFEKERKFIMKTAERLYKEKTDGI